ncbi:hypothetical protein D9K81_07845 [Acinetobacter chengduensis]|uniref:Uncharacterized protein n=2 Tax=Moraxellaceae TaxID=468 RepID=A0ABX9TXP4_9GAMM|nr:hypothetical protein [Acinetobacter sp. FL51]RKG39898.1 hypothetical protein D7V31_13155 [Acinetobacter sp. WCHAc060007]RLL22056.1 hypothetical protein D9K81_07845 [Acinetobacter chengduensis]
MMQHFEPASSSEIFSVATLLYARMRRMGVRVIDVMYMVENKQYAYHVIKLALQAHDAELDRLSLRLQLMMELDVEEASKAQLPIAEKASPEEIQEDPYYEATEDEIYKAQVSHHYIGALR